MNDKKCFNVIIWAVGYLFARGDNGGVSQEEDP